jgi:hypothetical protein
MADTLRAAFSQANAAPFAQDARHAPLAVTNITMIEFLFIYQLARNPLQAMTRRWWCRSLYRASNGKRRCPECTQP